MSVSRAVTLADDDGSYLEVVRRDPEDVSRKEGEWYVYANGGEELVTLYVTTEDLLAFALEVGIAIRDREAGVATAEEVVAETAGETTQARARDLSASPAAQLRGITGAGGGHAPA